LAILAAALYAVSAPCSKLLLGAIDPGVLAGLLYLGAGGGMLLLGRLRRGRRRTEAPLTRGDLPYTAAMVVLDIAAPVALLWGLSRTTAANASLLNNFEIAATAVIALVLFHEPISRRLWAAIALVTVASGLLSFEGTESLRFSRGSLLVLLACVCWGFENNCTRALSDKDPLEIVTVKGLGSGTGALALALLSGAPLPPLTWALPALGLGFVAYGLSIFFYIYAQRYLGAARTSAYYAVSPFLGAGAGAGAVPSGPHGAVSGGSGADGRGEPIWPPPPAAPERSESHDLQSLPPQLRRRADGDPGRRLLRHARGPGVRQGPAPPVGGALPDGRARRGHRVLLRVQSALLLLPERRPVPGGLRPPPLPGPPAGDLRGADRPGRGLHRSGDPHPLHPRHPGLAGPAAAGARGVELRRV
jgi:drug/metabolite transporter (DMT)-like permease